MIENAIAAGHDVTMRIAATTTAVWIATATIAVRIAAATALTLVVAMVMIVLGERWSTGKKAEHSDGNEESLHGKFLSRRVNRLLRQKFRALKQSPVSGAKTNCFADMFELPKSLKILGEACDREAIAFAIVDSFSGFVVRLSKGGRSVLVGAAGIGVYPLNRAAPFAIARDKAFTHYVLAQSGFAVPQGEHFFLNPPDRYVRPLGRERSDALTYGRELSRGWQSPLVVKPNSGKGARLVTFVRSEAELIVALEEIAPVDDLALVQAFVDAPEFRLFLVDGEIAFAYRKMRTEIVGDGTSTVRALCDRLIAERPEQFATLLGSSYLSAQLSAHGLTPDSVLSKSLRLAVDFVSNISASGRFDSFLDPSDALRAWARHLAKTVSLRVTGVDIFSASRLADTGDIIVTDVNGSPNLGSLYDLGHRDLVFEVWSSILRKTFDEPWPEGF